MFAILALIFAILALCERKSAIGGDSKILALVFPKKIALCESKSARGGDPILLALILAKLALCDGKTCTCVLQYLHLCLHSVKAKVPEEKIPQLSTLASSPLLHSVFTVAIKTNCTLHLDKVLVSIADDIHE